MLWFRQSFDKPFDKLKDHSGTVQPPHFGQSFFYTDITAFASWSAHEVGRRPQVLPASFVAMSSAFIPFSSFEIALRFPLHPFVKEMFVTTPLSSLSNCICVAQVFSVLYVYVIFISFQVLICLILQ